MLARVRDAANRTGRVAARGPRQRSGFRMAYAAEGGIDPLPGPGNADRPRRTSRSCPRPSRRPLAATMELRKTFTLRKGEITFDRPARPRRHAGGNQGDRGPALEPAAATGRMKEGQKLRVLLLADRRRQAAAAGPRRGGQRRQRRGRGGPVRPRPLRVSRRPQHR